MGNCNNFCQPEPNSQIFRDPSQTRNEKMDLTISCQLCGEQVQHLQFKRHLDFCHFGTIVQNKEQFLVQCLLCQFKTNSLEGFHSHFKGKHNYLKQKGERNVKQYQKKLSGISHQAIKSQIKKLKDYEFTIIRSSQKKKSHQWFQVSYESEKYDAIIYEKQYKALDYDEEKVKADLIWRYVFSEHLQCRYYSLDIEPFDKTMFCRSTLLIKSNIQ